MVCPRCAGENTLFIHEGPRKGTKNSFARSLFGLSTKSGGEHLFYPRRATKDHEEKLCEVIIWSVHDVRGRTPFLSTKGHERARRTPLQGHYLVCPRRAGENTFFIHEGPRRTTKKNFARSLFGLSTMCGGEHPFYPRRATKKTFARSLFCLCAKGRGEHFFGLTQIMVVDHENHLRNSPILPAGVLVCHIVSSFLQMSTEPGKHPGQTHLNSDAKIADEGHPQGGEGTHKGCPYLLFSAKKPASSRQRRLEFAIAHYGLHSSRRYALGRAPTRGAPTNCFL